MTTPADDAQTPPSPTILESFDLTPASASRAVWTGLLAYVAAWLAALVISGIGMLALIGEDDVPWELPLVGPGQGLAIAAHGTFTYSFDLDDFSDGAYSSNLDDDVLTDEGTEDLPDLSPTDDEIAVGSASLATSYSGYPLTLIAAALGSVWWFSRRHERDAPTTTRSSALSASLLTGAAFALATWGVAFAGRLRVEGFGSGHAGSLSILFFGTLGATLVALVARRPAALRRVARRLPSQLASATRAVAVYLAAFTALMLPYGVIVAVVESEPKAILTLQLILLNAAVYGLGFGQLGAVEAGGGFGVGGFSERVWIFSDGADPILWAVIPLSLLALALAVAVTHRRSEGRPRTSLDAFWLVATFAGVGAVLTTVGTFTSNSGGLGGAASFSIGLAPWFFLVMGVWGVVVEVAIRTIGSQLERAVPERLLRAAAGW